MNLIKSGKIANSLLDEADICRSLKYAIIIGDDSKS